MSTFALGLIVGGPLGAVLGYALGAVRAPRAILPPPIPAPSPAPEPSPIPPPPPLPTDDTQVMEIGGLPPELQRPGRRNHRRYEPPAKPVRLDPLDTTVTLPRTDQPARLSGEDTGSMPRVHA